MEEEEEEESEVREDLQPHITMEDRRNIVQPSTVCSIRWKSTKLAQPPSWQLEIHQIFLPPLVSGWAELVSGEDLGLNTYFHQALPSRLCGAGGLGGWGAQ